MTIYRFTAFTDSACVPSSLDGIGEGRLREDRQGDLVRSWRPWG
jgi:hypothetical protein